MSKSLCLLLIAPYHLFSSPVHVHLPCHYPFTNPSAPAVAFLQLLALCTAWLRASTRTRRQHSVGMTDTIVSASVQAWCSEGEVAAGLMGKPTSTPYISQAGPSRKQGHHCHSRGRPHPQGPAGKRIKTITLFLFFPAAEVEIPCEVSQVPSKTLSGSCWAMGGTPTERRRQGNFCGKSRCGLRPRADHGPSLWCWLLCRACFLLLHWCFHTNPRAEERGGSQEAVM